MFKNIVVGTDGSETANLALQQAITLAKTCDATLHIVHAYSNMTMFVGAMSMTGAPLADMDLISRSVAEAGCSIADAAVAAAEGGGVTARAHAQPGDACEVLIGVARDVDADLLVVGSRGMSGVKRFVLGSVPNKVAHHAPCSLMIVDTGRRPAPTA
jgi:nucleotide-binding universal stress UspA family protein